MDNVDQKQRHGCVTAWLILMIIANAFAAVSYLFMGNAISESLPVSIPSSVILLLGLVSIVNLIFAIMLFKWKKWAFWGFAATSIVALIINLSLGMGIGRSLLGLLGIVILYAVLQIQKNGVKDWDNLE